MNKRIILFLALLLVTGAGAAAQTILFMDEPVMGVSGYYRGPVSYRWGNFYDRYGNRVYAEELHDYYGVALYGSRYIRAKNEYDWGKWLTVDGTLAAVSFGTMAIVSGAFSQEAEMMTGFESRVQDTFTGLFIAGTVVSCAAVCIGIPLWVDGNRRLMLLADDFNRTFGPGYSSRLDFGTTPHGLGLSLRF